MHFEFAGTICNVQCIRYLSKNEIFRALHSLSHSLMIIIYKYAYYYSTWLIILYNCWLNLYIEIVSLSFRSNLRIMAIWPQRPVSVELSRLWLYHDGKWFCAEMPTACAVNLNRTLRNDFMTIRVIWPQNNRCLVFVSLVLASLRW